MAKFHLVCAAMACLAIVSVCAGCGTIARETVCRMSSDVQDGRATGDGVKALRTCRGNLLAPDYDVEAIMDAAEKADDAEEFSIAKPDPEDVAPQSQSTDQDQDAPTAPQ